MDFKISKANYDPDKLNKLSDDIVSTLIDNVAQSARAHWINLAKKDKSHLKITYLQSIQPIDVGKYTRTISLLGEVAHIIEDGSPRLDMRDTLLGPNVPTVPMGERGKHENKKGGFFRAIPFRHATPNAGSVVGQAMGLAYRATTGVLGKGVRNAIAIKNSKKLGRSIHTQAKKLTATTSNPYGSGVKWGSRLKPGYAPKLKAHHKTDIYAGMIRQKKTYEKATQNSYTTFRTISTNVTEGWIRKPIVARHYAEVVNDFVSKLIPKVFDNYINEVNK